MLANKKYNIKKHLKEKSEEPKTVYRQLLRRWLKHPTRCQEQCLHKEEWGSETPPLSQVKLVSIVSPEFNFHLRREGYSGTSAMLPSSMPIQEGSIRLSEMVQTTHYPRATSAETTLQCWKNIDIDAYILSVWYRHMLLRLLHSEPRQS